MCCGVVLAAECIDEKCNSSSSTNGEIYCILSTKRFYVDFNRTIFTVHKFYTLIQTKTDDLNL